jgi:hypothetical protein
LLVALLPVVARRNVDARALPQLNVALLTEHWLRPPQWIAVANPADVERALRDRGIGSRVPNDGEASSVTRQVGARLGVSLAFDSVRYGERDIRRTRVAARTKSGVDTAYTVEEGQITVWGRVNWREVHASGDLAEHGEVIGHGSVPFRRALYAGNWTDLDLKPSDRPQFEPRDLRSNQELTRQLARDLADGLAHDVFDAVLRRVQ